MLEWAPQGSSGSNFLHVAPCIPNLADIDQIRLAFRRRSLARTAIRRTVPAMPRPKFPVEWPSPAPPQTSHATDVRREPQLDGMNVVLPPMLLALRSSGRPLA